MTKFPLRAEQARRPTWGGLLTARVTEPGVLEAQQRGAVDVLEVAEAERGVAASSRPAVVDVHKHLAPGRAPRHRQRLPEVDAVHS